MEIKSSRKRLGGHAVPVILVMAAGLALSVFLLGRYDAIDQGSGVAVAKGLITPAVHLRPEADGSVKISFGYPSPAPQSRLPAMPGALDKTAPAGRSARLLLALPGLNFRR